MEFYARQIPGALLMMWFFGREGESLHVELRYHQESREFSLLIGAPAGERCERFSSLASCRRRLEELEHQLGTDRWVRARSGAYV